MATESAPLAELELRFAQQPNSDAFIPLARAYLNQGRLMEASVVCKKGLKGRPESIEGRLLMVEVLKAQNKSAKAEAELDALVAQHPENAQVRLSRARFRQEGPQPDLAREDVEAILSGDPTQPEALAWATERGWRAPPIRGPESLARAPSEPQPDWPKAQGGERGAGFPPTPSNGASTSDAGPKRPPRDPSAPAVSGVSGPGDGWSGVAASSVGPGPLDSAAHPVGSTSRPLQRPPMRLEGEDELEALAQRVAEERPAAGRPFVTMALLAVLVLASGAFMGWRYFEKNRIEAIDRLTTEALPDFRQDTYGGYQRAATRFEEILRNHDRRHPLTLGRLAHSLAILWGEHGDTQLQGRLEEALAAAREHAPKVSHTAAAQALFALYEAPDRSRGQQAALEALRPWQERVQSQGLGPTVADVALGVAHIQAGAYDEAVQVLSEAQQAMPSNVRAKVWLGVASRRAGRLSQATSALREALRLQPDHPGAIAHLALAQLERGYLQGAMKELVRFDQVAREHPKDVSNRSQALAEYARSEIARSAGEDAKGAGAYELAVRLDPDNSDFPFGLGRWLLKAQRPQDALEPLKKAAKMEPDRPLLQVTLAEALMELSRFDQAKDEITQVLAGHPDFVPGLVAKARWMRRTQSAETPGFLEQILRDHPSAYVDVKLELGRWYRQTGAFEPAKAALEEAVERMTRQPKRKQAEVLVSYGRLMEGAEDWGTAANAYEKAAEMGDLEAHYRLSKVALRLGDRGKAQRACTRYLAAGSSLRYSRNAQEVCDRL